MSDSSLDDFFEEGSEDSEKYSEDCSCKSGEEEQAASKDDSEPYNSASESENESPRNSWSENTVDSVSEDAENETDMDNEKKKKSDAEDSSKQYPDDASRSDDLEHLQMSQSNVSSSSSSSPSKGSRIRPQSGRSPMKVLISAVQGPPSTSDEPLRDSSSSAPRRDTSSLSSNNLSPAKSEPPCASPLLVRKSPIHVAVRSRDASPRAQESAAPQARDLQLSTSSKGINNVLSSKEQTSRGSSGASPASRPRSAAARPRIMDRESPLHKLPRHLPLGNYARSLKMLGVKMPSPTHKASRTPRSVSSQSWQSEGKLHTRVTRRSTSLEDVSRAIPQVKNPASLSALTVDEVQRATLSQAVYEEWYFKRCRQIRSQRVKAKDKQKEEERKKEVKNKEKEEKVTVAVGEWEEKKLEQKKKEREKKKTEAQKAAEKEKEQQEKQLRIAAAIEAWEKEKIALAKERREKKRAEKERKVEKAREQLTKREEAEVVFKSWKEQKKIEETEKRRRAKQEEAERKMKEEQEKLEKRQYADMSFAAWKKMKMAEQGENLQKVYQDSEGAKSMMLRRQLERSSEALEAYERWLEEVEDRRPARIYENARSSVLVRARSPWWPGGSRNSLLGC
ncbi:histone-lysine N-methyltransferase, H3 lysine-79 specific-like [Penaeus chinensis]|uniref:histone-lysine N-methyltransferase, H3 lysine-79 specific-like n=1 Tax=Penaeus chinensis TaxID=139456 RepID=UPI001FB5CB58|nr:histone-lysine N-methyltransferase, H3 lysine-79 specific-like [Penaeus chinensis]